MAGGTTARGLGRRRMLDLTLLKMVRGTNAAVRACPGRTHLGGLLLYLVGGTRWLDRDWDEDAARAEAGEDELPGPPLIGFSVCPRFRFRGPAAPFGRCRQLRQAHRSISPTARGRRQMYSRPAIFSFGARHVGASFPLTAAAAEAPGRGVQGACPPPHPPSLPLNAASQPLSSSPRYRQAFSPC
jgi:hypothetical protein